MFDPPNFYAGPSVCGVQAPSLGASGSFMLAPIHALGKRQVFKPSSGSALAPIVGWRLTWIIKDRAVRFEKGEPFCTVYPIPRSLAESMEPVVVRGEENSELWRKHMAHRMSRYDFNKALKVDGSPASSKSWQRSYYIGHDNQPTLQHRTKVKFKPFRDS